MPRASNIPLAKQRLLREMFAAKCWSFRRIAAATKLPVETVEGLRYHMGIPAMQPEPCEVRARCDVVRKARKVSWRRLADEAGADYYEVRRWTAMQVPAPPDILAKMLAWVEDAEAKMAAPRVAPPPDLSGLLVEIVDHDAVEDWLYYELLREGHSHDAALQRVAVFTPAGLLREVNLRRLRHGVPPYRVRALSMARAVVQHEARA